MEQSSFFPYRFNSFEPSVLVEIYLPKKLRYQGALYNSLRKGFDFDVVKDHLATDDPETIRNMEYFLKDYSGTRLGNIKQKAQNMERIFFGFSMYEVDGVFFDGDKAEERRKQGNREFLDLIIEERTQVIRLMFRPNLLSMFRETGIDREKNREEFNEMRRTAERALISYPEMAHLETHGTEKEQAIVKYINKWVDDVALFLFGFILYEICLSIKNLYEDDKERPEEEIWVTSLWNLNINRIIRQKFDVIK